MGQPAARAVRQSTLMAIAEAAGALSVAEKTVYRLISRGRLRAVRIPGLRRTFISRRDLNTLLAEARKR